MGEITAVLHGNIRVRLWIANENIEWTMVKVKGQGQQVRNVIFGQFYWPFSSLNGMIQNTDLWCDVRTSQHDVMPPGDITKWGQWGSRMLRCLTLEVREHSGVFMLSIDYFVLKKILFCFTCSPCVPGCISFHLLADFRLFLADFLPSWDQDKSGEKIDRCIGGAPFLSNQNFTKMVENSQFQPREITTQQAFLGLWCLSHPSKYVPMDPPQSQLLTAVL